METSSNDSSNTSSAPSSSNYASSWGGGGGVGDGGCGSGSGYADELQEFVSKGRTGRRNAVADISFDFSMNMTNSHIVDLMNKLDCESQENK